MVQFDDNFNPFNLPELIGAQVLEAEPIKVVQTDSLSEPIVDETFKPEIDFYQRDDHMGYSDSQISQDRARIEIEKVRSKKGRYCATNDWAVVYFKGFDQAGELRFTNQKYGKGEPKIFRIGHYQVSKCWDIAIQTLKAGEVAKVHCPSDLDTGVNLDQYSDFGSNWVSKNTDISYEIEVEECSLSP